LALEFAGEELQDDKEVVVEAVSLRGEALDFASEALQDDKDLCLLAARNLQRDSKLREDDDKPDPAEEISRLMEIADISVECLESLLAVAGERAPILTATLVFERGADQGDGVDDHKGGVPCFLCKCVLMSGVVFICRIADCSITDQDGYRRPGPILSDLAREVMAQLPKHTQVEGIHRVFINFIISNNNNTNNNDDDNNNEEEDDEDEEDESEEEAVAVTPWDWNRTLRDFLYSDEDLSPLGFEELTF